MSGLVLCGGASTRMGVDKAWLPVEGEPLVLRVARLVGEVAAPVALASGAPGRLGDVGYPQVADAIPDAGPLAGLVAGLEQAPAPLVAVVAVDLPFASPALLGLLAALVRDHDAAVPVSAHGPEPLHAVYRTQAAPLLRAALEEGLFGLRAALGRLDWRPVHETEWRPADPAGRFAVNLNRPGDADAAGLQP